MEYRINEIFSSVQGEGVLAGMPATFIRLQVCTVGCPWCDTKYTWSKGGTLMTLEQIAEAPEIVHVRPLAVITGGEPTIWNLDELIYLLRQQGQRNWGHDFKIQMETSGQNELKGRTSPDWITWSPKANLKFEAPKSIKLMANEVKWVVDDDLDIDTVAHRMYEVWDISLKNPPCVLMPEGTPPTKAHIDKTLEWLVRYPIWRYGNRLQWYLNVR